MNRERRGTNDYIPTLDKVFTVCEPRMYGPDRESHKGERGDDVYYMPVRNVARLCMRWELGRAD